MNSGVHPQWNQDALLPYQLREGIQVD